VDSKEVLSGLLGIIATKKEFRYHWRCEKEKITHLCFADDLLVFCRADVQSVRLVKECLEYLIILPWLLGLQILLVEGPLSSSLIF